MHWISLLFSRLCFFHYLPWYLSRSIRSGVKPLPLTNNENTMQLEVISNKAERPSLNEIRNFVGGKLKLLKLQDGAQMLINKEAVSQELPINYPASFQVSKDIFGNAMILEDSARFNRIYLMFSRNL